MAMPEFRGAGSTAMAVRAMTVPVESVTPPGATLPVPIIPAKWSRVPRLTRVAGLRPAASAASAVSTPTVVQGSASGGSRSSVMPMASSMGFQ